MVTELDERTQETKVASSFTTRAMDLFAAERQTCLYSEAKQATFTHEWSRSACSVATTETGQLEVGSVVTETCERE